MPSTQKLYPKYAEIIECDVCFKRMRRLNLYHHKRTLHSSTEKSNERYKCNSCEKDYSSKKGLYRHSVEFHNLNGRGEEYRQKHRQPAQRIPCPICKKAIREDTLKKHELTHTGIKPFKCVECDKSYTLKDTLLSHIKSVHDETQDIKCPTCEKIFRGKQKLDAHLKSHNLEILSCNKCDFKGKYLKEHLQSIHSEKRRKVELATCEFCQKVLTKSNINVHLNAVHSKDSKMYECERCHQSFRLKQYLKKHYENVHDESRDLKCKLCEKIFRGKQKLSIHVKGHNLEVLSCNRCDYKGKWLTSHIKKQHSNKEIIKKKARKLKKTQCLVCLKFVTGIKRHMVTHSNDLNYECIFCHQKYKSGNGLEHHIQSLHGEKSFPCKHCSKMFSTKQTRNCHEKIHSGKIYKRYNCNFCTKDFDRTAKLSFHLLKVHDLKDTMLEIFKCNICEKEFPENYLLKNHVISHKREETYKCEECGKGFSRKMNLQHHQMIHTTLRPYSCQYCRKAFNNSGTRHHHQNKCKIKG